MLTPISRLDAVHRYRARAQEQRSTGHTRVPAHLVGLAPSVVIVHAAEMPYERPGRAAEKAARAARRAARRTAGKRAGR